MVSAQSTLPLPSASACFKFAMQPGINPFQSLAFKALKIDVEGAEDKVLVPFFSSAPEALWPNLIIIEDTRNLWRIDLFSLLAERGYIISTRTKLNVMMRR